MESPQSDTGPATPHAPAARQTDRLSSLSFLGLLITQFLGAMNDNAFRWLIVPIGMAIIGEAKALSVGAAVFVFPFILFAAPAGYLGDRFSKRNVIVGCKLAEVILMILGVAAILYGNVHAMFVVLFLMGTHSALFSPSKYGVIPELVADGDLSAANGLVGMTTILAIVAGTVLGGCLFDWTKPSGATNWWISAVCLVGTATAGLISSLFIRKVPPANPTRPVPYNMAAQTYRDVARLVSNRPLFVTALGAALFWALGSLVQLSVALFAKNVLHLTEQGWVGVLLASLTLGVGLGNVIAGLLSKGTIELGMIFLGALGMSLGNMFVAGVPDPQGNPLSVGYILSCASLFLLGFGGGMYDVPIEAYLQHRAPTQSRGAVIAATNFITYVGMVSATGIFYLLTGMLHLSSTAVFLLTGLAMLPVAIGAFWLLPIPSARTLFRSLVAVFYRFRLSGLENIPAEGGALVVCNHVSWLDALVLMAYSPRPLRMLAYANYVSTGLAGFLARRSNTIMITPGRPKAVIESLRNARQALRDGDLIGIFPEGGITRTGHLQEFQSGVLSILKDTGCPVIPAYLGGFWGSVFSYFGGKFFWKIPQRVPYPISLRFGKPIYDVKDVGTLRQAVAELGVEAMNATKNDELIPPRAMLRMCRGAMRRSKMADTTGLDLTGSGLLLRSLIFRRLLRREILGPDEKFVGVLMPPSVGGAVANAALSLDHRVAVNLNYTVSSSVMNHCIAECGITHVLTSRRVMERFSFDLKAKLIYLEDFKDRVRRSDKLLSAAATWLLPIPILERMLGLTKIKPDDLLTIIFTSGSTGTPKGVMLSHHNVGANIRSFQQVVFLQNKDVLVGILPFFHSFGYTVGLWTPLMLAPKVVYHYSPLEAKQVGHLAREHRATLLIAAPTFLRSFVRRCEPEDFASLDTVITGAEKLPPDLADEFEARFHIRPVEGYGTTELSPVVSVNLPPSRQRHDTQTGMKEGSVGQPLPGIAAKVVDPDTFADLGTDTPGMLLISGPNVMRGYLNQPEETAKVIRDGWYVTGDIAVLDDEGFIHITGRLSRFSKLGGEMVPHIRIEEAIAALLPPSDVETPRVAVTAVPDPKKGERLVVLHTGLPLPPDQIAPKLAEQGLPPLWIPSADSYFQVEAIPLLGTGKLDLKQMREMAMALAMAPA